LATAAIRGGDDTNVDLDSLVATDPLFAGQLDTVAVDAKKALELNSDVWPGSILLSRIYLAQARPQEALPEIERVHYDALQTYLYAVAYHALGRERESDAALSKLIAKYSATDAYESLWPTPPGTSPIQHSRGWTEHMPSVTLV